MVAANDYDELRIWELTCLPTTTRERTRLRLGERYELEPILHQNGRSRENPFANRLDAK